MLFVKADEVKNFELKARRGYAEPKGAEIYRAIGSLPVGEGVVLNRTEWPYKSQPTSNSFPRRFTPRGSAYKVNTLATENGWLIRRVK